MNRIIICFITIVLSSNLLAKNEKIIYEDNITPFGFDGTSYRIVKKMTITPGQTGRITISALTDQWSTSLNGIVLGSGSLNYWNAHLVPPPENSPPSLDQNFIRRENILVKNITTDDNVAKLDEIEKTTSFEYFDGLGRTMQDVVAKGSPTKKDIIQPYEFDEFGRPLFEYLPYTIGATDNGGYRTDALTEQPNFYALEPKVATDTKPKVEHKYESSPLNRILKTYGAGSEWDEQNDDKFMKFLTKTNDANEVKKWLIDGSGLPYQSGFHALNTLLVNETTNEQGQKIKEYTNTRGLLVLKKVNEISVTTWMETYYIYDEFGSVKMILPPLLSVISNPNTQQVEELAFRYKYDQRRRQIAKKLPGTTDWHNTAYDHWDRPVLTQDPVQENASPKEYSITKYDIHNRAIITAKTKSNTSIESWRSTLASNTTNRYEIRLNNAVGYTLSMAPVPIADDIYTINYYDDYDFINYSGWEIDGNSFAFVSEAGFTGVKFTSVKGQQTGSKVSVLDSSPAQWLNTVIYYDDEYRILQTISENVLGGTERTTFEYDFTGRVLKSKLVQILNGSVVVSVLKEFDYDHAGRALRVWHTIDSGTKVLMVDNEYNELGELVEKNLHSTNNGNSYLQSVDYRYNIRGWLTHINNSTLSSDINNDDSNDLFGMELSYNEDFLVGTTSIPKQYAGNISAIKWNTNNLIDPKKERIYGYKYDYANRIKEARYASKSGSNWTGNSGDYDVTISGYDKNGNIQNLTRKGNGNLIDNLDYNYQAHSNQLDYVTDLSTNTEGFNDKYPVNSTEYEYDANGNMLKDINKEIVDAIEYNHLNLPKKVTFSGGHYIEFIYDATGVKVSKIVRDNNGNIIRQTDYTVAGQYEDGELDFLYTDEGRAIRRVNSYDYEYFLKDQVGNNRVVFGMLSDIEVYKATMEQALATQESAIFDNVNSTTQLDGTGYNRTPVSDAIPSPKGVVNVWQGTGPAITFDVSEGDKLELSVFAGYPNGTGGDASPIVNMAAAVATSFGISNVGETQNIYQAFQNLLPTAAGMDFGDNSIPRAYMTYVIFNSDYTDNQYGFIEMPASAYQTMELLQNEVVIPYNGTAYIYVANESDIAGANVYFDEFKIVHTKSDKTLKVSQVSDFYPFGMKIQPASYQNEGHNENKFTFQGQEQITDYNLEWSQFKWRNHDPAIGRFFNVDPLAEDYDYNSPYNFSENRVVDGVELEGLEWKAIKNANNKYIDFIWDPENAYEFFDIPTLNKRLKENYFVSALLLAEQGASAPITGDATKWHALATVFREDGKIGHFDATTLPSDNTLFGTVAEGLYKADYGQHPMIVDPESTRTPYPALNIYTLSGSRFLPAIGVNPSGGGVDKNVHTIDGPNVHKTGKNDQVGTYTRDDGTIGGISQGCFCIRKGKDNVLYNGFINSFIGQKNIGVILNRTSQSPYMNNVLFNNSFYNHDSFYDVPYFPIYD